MIDGSAVYVSETSKNSTLGMSRSRRGALRQPVLHYFVVLSLSVACLQSATQEDKGTVPAMVQEAKKLNVDHISYPLPLVLWADPQSPEVAIDKSSVIIAELIDQATTHTEIQLITWNKFRLIEILHKQPKSLDEPPPKDVPSSLLPINPGELLVPTITGSERIDGVTVSVSDPRVSALAKSMRYVLFVTFRSHDTASLIYGPAGIFALDANGLKPAMDKDYNRLAKDLADRQIQSLSSLKELAATRK